VYCLFGNAVIVSSCVSKPVARFLADPALLVKLRLVFATAGPHLWNSLPSKLRQCDSLRKFRMVGEGISVRGPRHCDILVKSAV